MPFKIREIKQNTAIKLDFTYHFSVKASIENEDISIHKRYLFEGKIEYDIEKLVTHPV